MTQIPNLLPGLREPKVTSKILKSDGPFPNNEQLPLLIYHGAFDLVRDDPASQIEIVFESNVWGGLWRSSIHSSHHYHSNAHEVLGCYAGSARIQFGGPHGYVAEIQAGDVAIVPAGVAHKNLGSSANFRVVGAYPRGQNNYDLRRGLPNERPNVDRNIAAVPLPDSDPVYGAFGPMVGEWKLMSKPKLVTASAAASPITAARAAPKSEIQKKPRDESKPKIRIPPPPRDTQFFPDQTTG